ncbi:MAG: hypothetical protein KatS3mg129_1456 [Leptospiraceae bacterium]|nr:MAG: hypothetical protein KatS3mg129_1456 [Leptospiraceae bacterium]
MVKNKILITIFIFLFYFSGIEVIYTKNTGKPYFEKAYSIEKEDPDKAIQYYFRAIEEGLNYDLKKTALWRLHFIFKEKKQFIKAWKILNQIPHKNSVESKFFDDVKYYAKLQKEDFLRLYNAIIENNINEVKRIYLYASPILKREILDYYLEKNTDSVIQELALVDTYNNTIDSKLFLVSYYMEKNYYDKAEDILYDLSINNSESLTASYKEKILYLLGKIKREKSILDSIHYFLLSANYSTTSRDYEKELALAMYSLYRSGYEDIVYELSDYIYYIPNEPMQKLFILLVKTEKNPDKNNLFELKKLVATLNKESFLVQKAQKLLIANGFYE